MKRLLFTLHLILALTITSPLSSWALTKGAAKDIGKEQSMIAIEQLVHNRPNKKWLYNYNYSLAVCIEEKLWYNKEVYEKAPYIGPFEQKAVLNDVVAICLEEMLEDIKEESTQPSSFRDFDDTAVTATGMLNVISAKANQCTSAATQNNEVTDSCKMIEPLLIKVRNLLENKGMVGSNPEYAAWEKQNNENHVEFNSAFARTSRESSKMIATIESLGLTLDLEDQNKDKLSKRDGKIQEAISRVNAHSTTLNGVASRCQNAIELDIDVQEKCKNWRKVTDAWIDAKDDVSSMFKGEITEKDLKIYDPSLGINRNLGNAITNFNKTNKMIKMYNELNNSN